jgi:hypothetical protein
LGCSAFFRFLLSRFAALGDNGTATASLGCLAALTAVFAVTAEAVVTALDADELVRQAAALVGLRVLAAELLQRARAHHETFGPTDAAIDRVFSDIETSLSVARGPRQARQMRLGTELVAATARR